MKFEESVLNTIKKHNMLSFGDTVVVGVSGGADSTALLMALCALKQELNLSPVVVHINHMLRGSEADRDCLYARRLAEENGLPFFFSECDVAEKARKEHISEEAAGREVRYDFFNSVLKECGGNKIAVAHNKNDSVETMLINLLRGSSLNGLKGISPVNGNVIRPLIECERKDIEAYLNERKIPFMTDSTNSENIYTRNIIRNVILPEMEKINPSFISTAYNSSAVIGDEESFLSQITEEYAEKCISCFPDKVVLDLSAHNDLHIALKRRLVLRACELLTGSRRNISSENLSSVLSLSTGGKTCFNNIFVERSYEKLEFKSKPSYTEDFSFGVSAGEVLYIPSAEKAYAFEIIPREQICNFEKNIIYLDAQKLGQLCVRSRAEGDSFSPLGLGGSKKVKDFLIDIKIPRNERSRLPVLTSDGAIAAILCLRPDEAFKITSDTKTILMISEVSNYEQKL